MNSKQLVRIGFWALAIFVILAITITISNGMAVATDEKCVQHYSLKGNSGLDKDEVPVFPADYWQANADKEPHLNNKNITWYDGYGTGRHYASHGSEGKRDWFYLGSCPVDPDPSPTPTEPTPTPTVTETGTPTPTPTVTEEPSATPTATDTPTPTPSATTESPDPSNSPTGPVVSPSGEPTPVEPEKTPVPETTYKDDKGEVVVLKPLPKAPKNPSTTTELAKTGPDANTTWLLIFGSVFLLIGIGLKRLGSK